MNLTAHRNTRLRLLFLTFALSGFSGLIYESIWSRYLGLFLGHAAYAQSLVLSIFMGGMALGSWLCSRWSQRSPNLLRGYAVIEGIIGVVALGFHEVFTGVLSLLFDRVIPTVSAPELVIIVKWGSAALLILPQSIFLGTTFPLMSGGVIRRYPERPGGTLAMLYFCNSIGGVAGVLTSGFYLIGNFGLPGTVQIAGAVNIALALFVWVSARDTEPGLALARAGISESAVRESASDRIGVLLLVSFLTGTSSFIYEIGWNRMLSMVLGSSTHSFELMLSAFILGLALGGLWIRKRIDGISDPIRFLALVHVLMGIFALATISVYGSTFSLTRWVLQTVPRNDYGYFLYSLSSHGIALLVMFPATFCAGMTLPLITHILLRGKVGERSIGLVYSANTVGAIAGVIFAVHVGMPVLGLKNLIVTGAGVDIGLGLLLMAVFGTIRQPWPVAVSSFATVLIFFNLFFVQFNAYQMASGAFRPTQRTLAANAGDLVVSHYDGKTATIDTVWEGTTITIRTNGKVDASVNRAPGGRPTGDEPTMVLSGALPILIHPKATSAANIGMGSGLSSQLLLMSPKVQRLDTIEIEAGMVEAAKKVRPFNELVFTDPRSQIHIEDAKTFFSSGEKKYDIIVSEPSNPWVSGVAGLFSAEFYDLIARHLNPNGVFLQWLQIYEIDVPLVASVLKALSPRFVDFQIYAVSNADILVVARNSPIPLPDLTIFSDNTKFIGELRRVGIASSHDLAIRRIASKKLLEPWLKRSQFPGHSDYYPRLDIGADRARFRESNARAFLFLRQVPLPVLEMLGGNNPVGTQTIATPDPRFPLVQRVFVAQRVLEYVQISGDSGTATKDLGSYPQALTLLNRCKMTGSEAEKWAAFLALMDIIPYVPIGEKAVFWEKFEGLPCAADLRGNQRRWLDLLKAVSARNPHAMAQTAGQLLKDNPPANLGPYLLTAAMLGHRVLGDMREAQNLAQNHDRSQYNADWRLVTDVLLSVPLESRINN